MFSENVQIALVVRCAYIITRQKISTVSIGSRDQTRANKKAEQGGIFRSIKYQSLLEDSAYCSEDRTREQTAVRRGTLTVGRLTYNSMGENLESGSSGKKFIQEPLPT